MWYAFTMWFGLIWLLILIDYSKNFVVLYASATYYFNSPEEQKDDDGKTIMDDEGKPKTQDGSANVMEGVKLAHFKHLGSIAFGALIITIIKVIRFVFVYLANQFVKASGTEGTCMGKMAGCIIGCGSCILKCFEKFCDYINTNAFAYMAVTGDNYCMSAYNGFLLLLKNATAFGAAAFFAKSLIFLGKFGVTVLNCFTLLGLMNAMNVESVSTKGPMLVVAILTWVSCEIWLSIFDQAISGIMMSYAVDSDLNKGEP